MFGTHVCEFRGDFFYYMLLLYPKFPLTEAGDTLNFSLRLCSFFFFTIVATFKTIVINIVTQCYKYSDSAVNIVQRLLFFFKG